MDNYSVNSAIYWSHNLIASEFWNSKKILDVWCNKWYLRTFAPNNVFHGIDYDLADLQIAKESWYEMIYHVDLNNFESFKTDNKYDIIAFGDVLEHVLYPEKVLKYFVTNFLNDNWKVIVSLPNVANFLVRFNLLFWKFDYTESWILDKTHLHLYTLKSGKQLIDSIGVLKINKIMYSSNNFGAIIKYFPFLWSILGYNLIYVCERKF